MPIEPGLTASFSATVVPDDTASAVGSGDVPVLATPRLVALCEQATVMAIAGSLPEGVTTVGSHIDLQHVAPSGVGATVRITAVLTRVEGRSLTFSVEAADGRQPVGRGTIIRVTVDRDRFVAGLGS